MQPVDWRALADSIIRVWNALGLQSIGLVASVLLVWKALDAWSRRK